MILLLLGTIIAIGTVRSLLRAICIKNDNVSPIFAGTVFLAVPGFFMSVYSLAFLEIDFSVVPQALLYTAVTIPCFFAGTVIELKALRCLEAGLYTITEHIMGLLGLIIFAYLLLGETLQGWEWLGLVCLSAGIFFAHSIARKHANVAKGLALVLAGSFLTALGLVVDKIILDLAGIGTFLFVAPGMVCLSSIIFYIAWQRQYKKPIWPSRHSIHWTALTASALLAVVGLYLYITTLDILDNIAYINTATSFTLVLSVILAVVFFREFADLKFKLAGLVFAIIGLLLL